MDQGTVRIASSMPRLAKRHLGDVSIGEKPWLVKVDGHRWTIRDVVGEKNDTRVVNFNRRLADGSSLVSPENEYWYEAATEYAVLARLYSPDICAAHHLQRVNGLMAFFSWLRLHHVSRLRDVTPDHLEVFSERVAYGIEWTLELPRRIFVLLVAGSFGKEIPLLSGRTIDRKALCGQLGAGRPQRVSKSTSMVLDWGDRLLAGNGEKYASFEDFSRANDLSIAQTTARSMLRYLLPIEDLWIMRSRAKRASLHFEPFRLGASKVAFSLGRQGDRHLSIPPKLAFSMMGTSIKWTLGAQQLLGKGWQDDDVCRWLADNMSPKMREAAFEARGGIGVRFAEQMVLAAAFFVIAVTTARRLEEILMLEEGCVSADAGGKKWLRVYIEKTLRRHDHIPIPAITAHAISVVEGLGRRARTISGKPELWQSAGTDGIARRVKKLRLTEFARYSGTLQEVGLDWSFRAHQARRFFALFYFWRYEKGDLGALAHHLRHFDLEMTRRYVTDVKFGRMWKEYEEEWRLSFLLGITEGSRSVGGRVGKLLRKHAEKLVAAYREKVDVVAPKKAAAHLLRLANRFGVSFKPQLHGTVCACPSKTTLARFAQCKGAKATGPDYENASIHHCSQCVWAIYSERFPVEARKELAALRSITMDPQVKEVLGEYDEIVERQVAGLERALTVCGQGEAGDIG